MSAEQEAKNLLAKIERIVDRAFCEMLLRQLEAHEGPIEVKALSIRPATNKGDNYTSDMFRVSLDYVSGGREKKTSLVVKSEPLTDGIHKDMISRSTLFSTEIRMMSDSLTKMNGFLAPGQKLNGRGLYTQKENPPMLVIEDLQPLGFRMADRESGLDYPHCLLAVKGLARFHASSVALCEKEPEQKDWYRRGIFVNQPDEVKQFFTQGARSLAQEAANWPELDQRIVEKIRRIADDIYERGSGVSDCRSHDFNVINHGDFWVNNMLFKYDANNRPIGHIFVDFQLCLYSSPGVDLQYFFNTSLSDDMLLAKESALLEAYLAELEAVMKAAGCRTRAPSMAELQRMMRERATYGMVASFTVLPLVLVEKSEVKSLDEMMSSDGTYDNPAYRGKAYRKAMVRRLPKFDQLGLLD
ncbi:unnamed protein product [Trichogramma brassicae]|uniref:CHK kinase-like domain-containing protein n=1 Tax=Trichogramma brassicae TaxID=86971 RepID=A0A6H5I4I4_9HYME|nr:unnamed protein product [Trichogramma brassicae]